MKERGIIFKGWGVRAIRNMKPGVWPAEAIDPSKPIKWQTRRVIKPQPVVRDGRVRVWKNECPDLGLPIKEWESRVKLLGYCPYGIPGDGLWVRETWQACAADGTPYTDGFLKVMGPAGTYVAYKADSKMGRGYYSEQPMSRWRPSIHMFRWASRDDLLVKEVRVERVQEITLEDCVAEGMMDSPLHSFMAAWDSINQDRGFGWHANPWVWVVSYMRKA